MSANAPAEMPLLYDALAAWWPLMSAPTDYGEEAAYAYLLRDRDGSVQVIHDRHIEGVFARADWLRLLSAAGFPPTVVPFDHSELEPGSCELFVCTRPR